MSRVWMSGGEGGSGMENAKRDVECLEEDGDDKKQVDWKRLQDIHPLFLHFGEVLATSLLVGVIDAVVPWYPYLKAGKAHYVVCWGFVLGFDLPRLSTQILDPRHCPFVTIRLAFHRRSSL